MPTYEEFVQSSVGGSEVVREGAKEIAEGRMSDKKDRDNPIRYWQ
jgi:hypothetical protein